MTRQFSLTNDSRRPERHVEVDRKDVFLVSLLGLRLLLWLLFVNATRTHELWMAVLSSVLAATACEIVREEPFASFRPRLWWLIQVWREPWYILQGRSSIFWSFFKHFLNPEPSVLRQVVFDAGGSDPHSAARRALAIAYTTMPPNFIVLGIDPDKQTLIVHQVSETPTPAIESRETAGGTRVPLTMILPAFLLLLLAVAITFVPDFRQKAELAGMRFQDQAAYQAEMLARAGIPAYPTRPNEPLSPGIIRGLISTLLAISLAGYALFRKHPPFRQIDFAGGFSRVLKPLRIIHSGNMCDYIAWLTFGVALFGGLFALFTR